MAEDTTDPPVEPDPAVDTPPVGELPLQPDAQAALPDIESPDPADVLDSVPSTDEIIADAETAEQILERQPSPEQILGEAPGGPG